MNKPRTGLRGDSRSWLEEEALVFIYAADVNIFAFYRCNLHDLEEQSTKSGYYYIHNLILFTRRNGSPP